MTALLLLLGLLDLEALACLLLAFLTPSESGQGIFLWLSRERLALVAVSLLVFLVVVAVTLYVLRFREQARQRMAALEEWPVFVSNLHGGHALAWPP